MNASSPRPRAGRPALREHPLESLLGLFAEVHVGEAVTALILTLDVFLLLASYYLLKVAREPLILMGGGAEVKTYASAGQAILLVFVAMAYGALASRIDRMKFVAFVTLFFASNLVVFFILGNAGVPLGVPFYLWVGIFSDTITALFWSFAADVYSPDQGKRLFPVIGIGSAVGAVAGAWIAKRLLVLGPYGLMLVAASVLIVCLFLTWVVHRRAIATPRFAKNAATDDEAIGKTGGFSLLVRDRYLLSIAALMFILNSVNTTGEYVLDRTLVATAADEAARAGMSVNRFVGTFKAEYFQWVNVFGVLMQFFVVSRVIKHLGVRRALFVMPVVSLAGYSVLAFLPQLSLIFIAKVAENSIDYSLQNTCRHALWLLTSREAKYKVKQIADAFVKRAGDVMAAILVWVGGKLGFQTVHFVVGNIFLVGLWFLVLVFLAREHRKRSAEGESLDVSVAVA